jgi:hypothetical protein
MSIARRVKTARFACDSARDSARERVFATTM